MDGNGKPFTVEGNHRHNETKEKNGVSSVKISEEKDKADPWAVVYDPDQSTGWSDLTTARQVKFVLLTIIKVVILLSFVYLFICALGFLHDAFQLLGGETAGKVFQESDILSNPVAGLMIGVLATAIIQSSSTTISIVITMAGAKVIPVRKTIPIIMGANIGTTVTNTVVSLVQAGSREEFRKAFGGATIHDVFNWLTVFILLPVEVITGYLYHLTSAIVSNLKDLDGSSNTKKDILKKITKPFIGLFVKVNKNIIKDIALKEKVSDDSTVLKRWCGFRVEQYEIITQKMVPAGNATTTTLLNQTKITSNFTFILQNVTETKEELIKTERCKNLFAQTDLSDDVVGFLLLVLSLILIILCLFVVVKILNSIFKGTIAKVIKKFINSDFPGKLAFLTGYVAILIGTGMTMVIQSSSIFTSTLTPLVGVGIVSLERMYPLTIGANIGTTLTGILAALALPADRIPLTLQVAFCHLFFNLSGTLIFYPIPIMRKGPINVAKILGNTIAEYRWFAIVYVICLFFAFPAIVFGLSLAGTYVIIGVGVPILVILIVIIVINICQRKCPQCIPKKLQNWNFLPLWMHSLAPLDNVINRILCGCCKKEAFPEMTEENGGKRDDFITTTILI